ncbi:hypothetical protein BOTBODRAFT_44787 [Botryobasidium botryosum FD-172 SS1]|uniref:F-box domain-containing protein n=1 Tax=Botryobasidium botryosum (strain FD-172 SS1) TaxID=930990 RepID=A0A067MQG2_BOTB1|nr:hypothetical protein BOTBODRAFT_44787 [Botryobasidium botryosum FD-172 SS1]
MAAAIIAPEILPRAIHRIPVEIFQEIFIWCIEFDTVTALDLTHVCRLWRATAHSGQTWKIWCRIDVNLSSSRTMEKVNYCLHFWTRRPASAVAVLHITIGRRIRDRAPPQTDVPALVSLLGQFGTHWTSLSFSSSYQDGTRFLEELNSRSIPVLESLHLEGFHWSYSNIRLVANLLIKSPLLKTVDLQGKDTGIVNFTPLPSNITLPRVTRFRAEGMGSTPVLNVLSLPAATVLQLVGVTDRGVTRLLMDSPKAREVSARNMAYKQGQIHLPPLFLRNKTITSLELSCRSLKWFSKSGFAALRSLVVSSTHTQFPAIGAALQATYKIARPPLTSLRLVGLDVSDLAFTRSVRCDLLSLERLEFVNCRFSRHTVQTLTNRKVLLSLSWIVIERCPTLNTSATLQIIEARHSVSACAGRNLNGQVVFDATQAPKQEEVDELESFAMTVKVLEA